MAGTPQVLSDSRGTVVAGRIDTGVYYIRIVDFITTALGMRFSALLRHELAAGPPVAIFVDAEAAQGSDFSSRSAIMQTLMAQRKQIASVTILVTAGPLSPRATEMAAMLGCKYQFVDSQVVFQMRLRELAPSTRSRMPSSGHMPVARSVRPGARSVRPAARSARPPARSRRH